jgi:hypothetical protein
VQAGQWAPGDVQFQADADRRVVGAHCGVDQVEVFQRVDHQGDPPQRGLVLGQPAQGAVVDGRVRDQQVFAEVVAGEPERLGQRVAHDTGVAGLGEDPFQQVTDPDRLAGDPDRPATRPADQVRGVVVERVEVDDRERRIEVLRCRVEAGSALHGFTVRPQALKCE